MCVYIYIYIHTFVYTYIYLHLCGSPHGLAWAERMLVCAALPLATVDFRNFVVFFLPRPWHIEIRHRVRKTSTIDLFGFETLKLKIRRLKLWKPTVSGSRC